MSFLVRTYLGLSILSTIFFGLNIQAGGANLNPERILYFASPIFLVLSLRRWFARSQLPPGTILYGLWVVANAFALLLSTNPQAHLPGLLICTIPFVYFLIFASSSANDQVVDQWVLVSIVVCELLAIAAFSGAIDASVAFEGDRLRLTMFEPNILGAVVGAFYFLLLPGGGQSPLRRASLFIAPALVLLSFSKGPYFAFLFCAGVYYLLTTNKRKRSIGMLVAVFLSLVLMLVIAAYADEIQTSFDALLARPDAINSRLLVAQLAWYRFLAEPIFGNGPLDMAIAAPQVMSNLGSDSIRSVWIAQIFLSILHDSGILGFAAFLLLLARLSLGFARVIRNSEHPQRGASYFCAFLMLVICSQATSTHLNAVFGIIAGLLASYIASSGTEKKRLKSPSGARHNRSASRIAMQVGEA